jgi:hypothetical protein
LVYRVEGIDLRVDMVGVCFRGLKDWKAGLKDWMAYACGVWRLIGRDTFVGL